MRRVKWLWLFCVVTMGLFGCADTAGQHNLSGGSLRGVRGGPDFVSLVKKLQPAVVNVTASVAPPITTRPGANQGAPDNSMGRSFGAPGPQRQQGSGFIIKSDGIILTNAHVIEGAKKIIVKLGDKREFEAQVVGTDLPTDVALLKISAKENLPTAGLGDSDRVEVGEWVMAVGNPFGLDSSVSSGIVSGKGRHIGEAYDRLIQTDAPLNPGSSGGPLINLRGQVVGINKAIVSETGGSIGISFATPINSVKEILPQLETKGRVTRSWAGLAIQEMNAALADTLGVKNPGGALVAGVVKGGPADRGGVKLGDVITEFDGKAVKDALDLPIWIARTPLGKQVQLKIQRDQQQMDLQVTVTELPQGPMHAKQIG
jgi:serine protease Do